MFCTPSLTSLTKINLYGRPVDCYKSYYNNYTNVQNNLQRGNVLNWFVGYYTPDYSTDIVTEKSFKDVRMFVKSKVRKR